MSDLTRRDLVGRAALIGAALSTPRWLLPGSAPAAALSAPFSEPLRIPRVLKGARIKIPIVPADVQLLQGDPTRMWTFGGTFPGPTIRRPAGATTTVEFAHGLPARARSLTIHNHGHHTASKDDGQPTGEFLEPGRRRTYTYRHVDDGAPMRGSMRWYHDHSHGRTGLNSWMGLLGAFIIDDPGDAALGLPRGRRELVLLVTERSFDAHNQLDDPFTGAADPSDDSVGQGDVILVNGVHRPYVQVRPTTYRLRVLNAASFRPYNLGFKDGPKLLQVGTESGLFEAPIQRERVLLGPAERADLVVDFSGLAGRDLVVDSVPQTGGPFGFAAAAETSIMQFRVRGTAGTAAPVAKRLRALPAWVKELSATPDRVFAFGRGVASDGTQNTVQNVWTINGRVYDPNRVFARPELGSTETWMLVNASTQSHYIHLHGVDWKLIARNGAAPDPWEDALKETFRLDPGEVLTVGTKFTDHLGRFMLHCHMFSHEDHAMMAAFEVARPGQGDSTPVGGILAALTEAEALRVGRMLRAQAERPGHPVAPPATPLRLAPDALAYCDLEPAR